MTAPPLAFPRLPRARAPRLAPWVLLGALGLLQPATARAIEAASPSPSAVARAAPALPRYVEPELPKPKPGELERLEALWAELARDDVAVRRAARERLSSVDATWLPALLERFDVLCEHPNKPKLKAFLEHVRRTSRGGAEATSAAAEAGATPDDLDLLIEWQARGAAELEPLTRVLASSRMLERIGTLPAARRLVSVYVRFGEFLRSDTERALARLGDRAVPALIEATGHPVARVATWARRQLEALGRAEPSEAMRLEDVELRAQVARALGKVRRVEAAPLLVSYANGEHARVRSASREALVSLGDAAVWPLRDAYERTLGERAPLEWAWERVARELFAAFDRRRFADLHARFEAALGSERRGDLAAACSAFDAIIARAPDFERNAEMAPIYFRCAEARAEGDPESAILALRRAERLAGAPELEHKAGSLRRTLEARRLLARGVVDPVLIQRARELDPQNARALELLESAADAPGAGLSAVVRYIALAAIALVALLGLGWMLARHRYGGLARRTP